MRIQFDPNQQFQLDAVDAVVDLFDGQERGAPEFSVIKTHYAGELLGSLEMTETGVGNRLLLSEEKLQGNARLVQERNDIDVVSPTSELKAWELFDAPANRRRNCPHFSVEMETGTGKTYVYLRTIFELSHRYGFQKFIIVVPSVAIREGVLKNIEITKEHFRAIYNNLPFESFVYDAKKVNRLRHFATSNTLQIQVINIDAFRKNFTGTETEQRSNVIYKESDKLAGRQPIEFVQAARPIVIIDEPQSVDSTDKAQEAIKALNPLMTLRYSATHKNPYNLVYRLDPVRAFELRLVKQIVVANVESEDSVNEAFIRVESIEYKNEYKAKLRMLVKTVDGPKEKTLAVKPKDDLFYKSGELHHYQDGFRIADLSAEPGDEHIRFSNGKRLNLGEEMGGARSDVWRAQIRKTIEEHLKKEVKVKERGIKVLSLFFIDRVANYRDYDDQGATIPGKFALAFEEELAALAKDSRFASLEWLKLPVGQLHNGYFSGDRKKRKDGTEEVIWKDTKGSTAADDDTYNLIMKEKERLLSFDEPLRFIFSHSALREGWDNPNVFQICTLNETQSSVKKRQEIGRGLRLPVDQNGLRVFDDSMNKLYVMANESYESFAKALQTEYEEDCGVTFGKVPITALAKLTRVIDDEEVPLGRAEAEVIRDILIGQKMIDSAGRIQAAFDPRKPDFKLNLPDDKVELAPAIIDLLSSYQIERHIQREKDEGPNKLKKQILLSPEFEELWKRIKPKTTYRVEFTTPDLVQRAVAEIKRMPRIEKPVLKYSVGGVAPTKAAVQTTGMAVQEVTREYDRRPLPDILAYLQNETELTRSTLVEVLKKSDRLTEFFNNPQRFMDEVARILKHELHRLLVDGIKYERISGDGPDAAYDQMLFRNEELINYFTALEVKKSVYDYVVYDSEIEREFAKKLDERDDIKLFVKLPAWFKVETPVGEYNPDWAIVKHDTSTIYLVRETKGTKDFLKLRTTEADKIRCGQRHFEALGQDFDVVVTAGEV
jgi:type III restriction enzyme